MSMLGFFRKRQKLIFVIMVVLMVAFLVGMQGFEMLFGRGGADATMAETEYGPLSFQEVDQAGSDMQILNTFIRGFGPGLEAAAYESLQFQADGSADAAIAYAMLLKEAQAKKLRVTEADVDMMVKRLREAPGFDYDGLVMHFRQNQSVPEKAIRAVLGRWAMVLMNYQASTLTTPPSQAQLRHLYRDISEQLKLRVVKIDPAVFIEEVGEPTDEDLQAMFEDYKGRPAGEFQGIDAFSFGYLQPARVRLAWLFIHREAVQRGALPTEQDIDAWIRSNEDELVKEVAAEDDTEDAPTADDGETVTPQVMKTVPMTPAEKRRQAIQALQPQVVSARADELMMMARREIIGYKAPEGEEAPAPGEAYLQAARSFELPGEDLLSRGILVLVVDEPTPLRDVVESVAAEAEPRLASICFPWGKHGDIEIDPEVKVKAFAKRNLTVGEALKLVAGEIEDLPELTWSMCDGFDDVLFTTGGVRFFPVSAGVTELDSLDQLRKNELLANARARGGSGQVSSLLGMAFNAKSVNEAGTLAVGEDGPAMTTWTPERSGWVLWRLLEATKPVVPTEITDAIREELVRDWKLQKAFELAKAKAAEITTAEQLDAWIKEHNIEPIETNMLARKRPAGPMAGGYVPSRLASLGFSDVAVDMYVLGKAFTALAPSDPDGDYPQVSTEVASVPLPSEGEVLLMQRIDYRPAMADGYDLMQKSLMDQLEFSAGLTTLRQWFNPSDIRKRVDYREKQQ